VARNVGPDSTMQPLEPAGTGGIRGLWPSLAEAAAVLCSPLAAFVILRLRPMAPGVLADPNIQTAYIVHPRDLLARYSTVLAPEAGLRELGRVGFLVPAHLVYLVVGAVPEFYVMRYLFALIAVVPTYVLLRRHYGRAAGATGIILVMSSPVIVTAWGTDYPDSAAVSYLIGSLACVSLSLGGGHRRLWLSAAGVLATMAVWSHSIAIPLLAVIFFVFIGIRALTDRHALGWDLLILGAVGVVVTFALGVGSQLLFGRSDFIAINWDTYRFYSQPAELNYWHTGGTLWLSYLTYLLVPPAVLAAWIVTFWRRPRAIPTPQLLIGLVCAGQIAAFSYMQFFGKSWTLEQHYLSSTLFAGVTLTLAITLSEMCSNLLQRPLAKWILPALALAVPLIYEAGLRPPSFRWSPTGIVLAIVVFTIALVARLLRGIRPRSVALVVAAACITGVTGSVLALMVTPIQAPGYLPGTGGKDPTPAYSTALGGSGESELDQYRVAVELPSFVGPADYRGEQLLVVYIDPSLGPLSGMYHGGINSVTLLDPNKIPQRRPAELLVLSKTPVEFGPVVASLHQFQPTLLKKSVLRSGSFTVHVWLIKLGLFSRPTH
jgi:hypothetical protein